MSATVTGTRPPVAWGALLCIAMVKVAIHLVSSTWFAYGYLSDELYYLDCARRLDWGYVDHPPLSIAVLALVRSLLGESLPALRLLPALAGAGTIIVCGLIARELGGGRVAQTLAALGTLGALIYLAVGSFYSMNAFDPLVWALAYWLVVRLLADGAPRLWLALGALIGIGILNKLSIVWLAGGLTVAMVLGPQRRWLRTPWPWMAAFIAALFASPHLVWQWRHDWATLEFFRTMQSAAPANPPLEFLRQQLVVVSPFAVPLWVAGLAFGLRSPLYRPAFLIWIAVFLFLLATGTAQIYYIGPAYSLLLAAGGVAIERASVARRWKWLPLAGGVVLAAGAAVVTPFIVDYLPPERLARGDEPPADDHYASALPSYFALRFGWPELAAAVAAAYASLPAEERAEAGILANSFSEAGALNFYGPRMGLPVAISPHNNYWLWGPHGYSGAVMIVVADTETPRIAHHERPRDYRRAGAPVPLSELFAQVERAGPVDCRYCSRFLRAKSVYICRGSRAPLSALWPALKEYI